MAHISLAEGYLISFKKTKLGFTKTDWHFSAQSPTK
jgi:hypothetical protein